MSPGGKRTKSKEDLKAEHEENAASAWMIFPAPAPVVYAFVSDLDNHGSFASGAVRLASLDGPEGGRLGGRLELATPWGRRSTRLRIGTKIPPVLLNGTAEAGKSELSVIWKFEPHGDGTKVTLSVIPEKLSLPDMIIWNAGGRGWLTKQLGLALSAVEAEGSARAGQ